jgi:glucosamine-6-phosphate deaminase
VIALKEDYFDYSKGKLLNAPKIPLRVMEDDRSVFKSIAQEMLDIIVKNNNSGNRTVFICPVGPVGQYPFFVDLVNAKDISLKDVWFINMDEYLDENLDWIDRSNRLSFRGFMENEVYSKIDKGLLMAGNQRIFPDPKHLSEIPELIERLGGVDAVFGGIGITGHVAFNEPSDELTPDEFLKLPTRTLEISPETRTVNSISDLNGAVDAMPRHCVTVGMKEIYSAKRIRLACFRGWHRAVVRKACHGEQSARFPVTLLQNHRDIRLTITEFVAGLE